MMEEFPIQIPDPSRPFVAAPVATGQAGLNAYQLAVLGASGAPPFVGTMAEWLSSLVGSDGDAGKSAYQHYLDTTTDNPVLTEQVWAANRGDVSITSGPVTIANGESAIADDALSVAKTAGLQTQLDAKLPLTDGTHPIVDPSRKLIAADGVEVADWSDSAIGLRSALGGGGQYFAIDLQSARLVDPGGAGLSWTLCNLLTGQGVATLDWNARQLLSPSSVAADWSSDNGLLLPRGVKLSNGAFIRPGTVDSNLGGLAGVSQICPAGYELKWEAGRLYVMEQGGNIIRSVLHTGYNAPDATNDSTQGFVGGSRWILDDGTEYRCYDDSPGTAVWHLKSKDALRIAYDDPNTPLTLTVSGISLPEIVDLPVCSILDNINGGPHWAGGSVGPNGELYSWEVYYTGPANDSWAVGGAQFGLGDVYESSSPAYGDTSSPQAANEWVTLLGEGTPVFQNSGNLQGDYNGQLLLSPVGWWAWDALSTYWLQLSPVSTADIFSNSSTTVAPSQSAVNAAILAIEVALAGKLASGSNLADLGSAALARSNLGLGTANSPYFAGLNTGAIAHTGNIVLTPSGGGNPLVQIQGDLQFGRGGSMVSIYYTGGGFFFGSGANATFYGNLSCKNSIVTALSLTGSAATNSIDVSSTWNTTGNPSLIYGRVTNTASGASANLIDLGTVAGGSLFKVDKTGLVNSAIGFTIGSSSVAAIQKDGAGALLINSSTSFGASIYGKLTQRGNIVFSNAAYNLGTVHTQIEINSGVTGELRDIKLRNVIQSPGVGTTVTPASNGDLVFEATSDTSVTAKLKGSDGTVRSVILTLA